MIRLPQTTGNTYAVMGLGLSGLIAAEALQRSGANVTAWDDDGPRREAAALKGIPLGDLGQADFSDTCALVLSPGIPHSFPSPHPVAERARGAGVPIICDVELLAEAQRNANFIGITGTNGKSTVTALLGHIFANAGRKAAIGGNLGPAALGLSELGADGTYILELSSYQIERITAAAFDIAVLINISPDHLDRHGGIDGYVAAKENLFALTRNNAIAIVGTDDDHCRALCARLEEKGGMNIVPISGSSIIDGGIGIENGCVIDNRDGKKHLIADIRDVENLPGAHNHQNAAAATATALAAGIDAASIATALKTYPGLAHRQELIRRAGTIRFVNDSKATNPIAALRALECYDHVYWIAGGRAKDGGFEDLAPAFSRIKHAFLIGEAADDIANTLGDDVPHSHCDDLDGAIAAAYAAAASSTEESVVLLSPACASFDQFANFEARGMAFRHGVEALETGS
ncbi:MAG: UDP-N-acetylmuramoyl-L-alanine--D-glutamate ligase [Rhodospirillales bacterium]|jgi:UDP-N-acetylmuramoylalanine--D-glutamate ligase|nr:UDP-N-acetylmuramoyl-L-alanine--D-glutamate ligase [Rhodospirillales bacterium]MBT4006222.1 UDP-N-acetylmuramoyl-L-alanine--D-glutamate ligase [Rhodospirillales bacterium]MBT5075938.1 UDP-N-acetylmuramoyl-L-alanine--D-glutamate ligase [Rhodospirillales bacterium]MBT5113166.1 UDP-N-acetylmuramoyl-L-alanine--D-glutamate ligase [Rhodospirillales bacterium]MBT5673042.1 UDP-N-acetylmuramoyl-L-alanine--D-glutamate ligase [Rhodospirillales bacterium]